MPAEETFTKAMAEKRTWMQETFERATERHGDMDEAGKCDPVLGSTGAASALGMEPVL